MNEDVVLQVGREALYLIVELAGPLLLAALAVGLLVGVGVLELVRSIAGDADYFKNPGVDLRVALIAFTVLIISGLLAGLLPARRALAIKAIDALRTE